MTKEEYLKMKYLSPEQENEIKKIYGERYTWEDIPAYLRQEWERKEKEAESSVELAISLSKIKGFYPAIDDLWEAYEKDTDIKIAREIEERNGLH